MVDRERHDRERSGRGRTDLWDRLVRDKDFSLKVMIGTGAAGCLVAAALVLMLLSPGAQPAGKETSAGAGTAAAQEKEDEVISPAGEEDPSRSAQKLFPLEEFDQAGGLLSRETAGISEAVIEDASDPYRDKPDIDISEWMYILANPWNDISDYEPSLASLEGQQFDERIIGPMQEFVGAARDEGLSVFLSSGYRSYDTQSYLFNRKAAQYGEEVAETIVARPGTSEHQTGLCCDITDRYYEMKDESLENTALYQWMSGHCHEYGFIVRFPKGREDVTGIIYEPWHFRYVGVEAAAYITEHDLTLEEFLDLYKE